MREKNRQVLLHLFLIPNVGSAVILKIIKKFYKDLPNLSNHAQDVITQINLDQIYDYNTNDFFQHFDLPTSKAKMIFDGLQDKKLLEKELQLIEKYKIDFVTLLDNNYPIQLTQIYLPPIILYSKGKPLSCESKNMAIVGSRKANEYAKNVIDELVYGLVSGGWHIVSGGALGADSMAHEAVLDSKGITISVIGSGLLNFYPVSNKNLFKKIVSSGGTLISSFPLQFPPERGNFPARNRIIAGLSQGCIVVQAAKKSGALITAKFALEQGRQVFAIPGSIFDELSVGPNDLIKQGAKIIGCLDDILEEFGEKSVFKLFEEKYDNAQAEKTKKAVVFKKDKIKNIEKTEKQLEEKDPILKELAQCSTIDQLTIKTGLSLEVLQNKLFEFQLDGKVKQNFAGNWELV